MTSPENQNTEGSDFIDWPIDDPIPFELTEPRP